jgi:recombination protein RecA
VTLPNGKKSTKILKRLATAEELIEEAESVLEEVAGKDQRVVIVVDRVTAMLPEDQAAAGIANQSMKTEQALPKLLGYLLRRWVALLQEKNALAIFINQLRTKPGISFGDPDYTPGGNALPFYCHVRVRARRKGKRLLKNGKPMGVQGVLVNVKNKAGGEEGAECGFALFWDGRSKFFNAADLKKEE